MTDKPVAEWTDDEIRSKLSAMGESVVPITATTRPFLMKKIEKFLQRDVSDTSQDATQGGADSGGAKANSKALASELEQQDCCPVVDGYYTIHVTNGEEKKGDGSSPPLFTSRADALKAVKNTPGARFKKFESKDAALAYLDRQKQHPKVTSVSEDTDSAKSTAPSERANNFPGLNTPALNKFRKLIEEGDVESFRESVWTNPRHLITSGDTPEILQQGCRYNALHCAVKKGNLEMCKEILDIIEGDKFWKLVYPDDSEAVRHKRKDHLVDLYLNMQDKVNRESPLHFACKYGHADIATFLLSYPKTCQTIKNQYGQIPADVVCKDGNQPAKSKIEQLLKEPEIYYVSVLRSKDNSTPPRLSSPCTLPELANHQSPLLNSSDVTSPVVGHALAGPMSPSRAKDFYKEWRSPSHSMEKRETTSVKRSDPERGMERVGRKLAHGHGIGWKEFWHFLGCSCDLSLPEGHLILEDYIRELSYSSDHLSQSLLEGRGESECPLTSATPNSAVSTAASKSLGLKEVSGKPFCENGCEDKQERSSFLDDKVAETSDEVDNVVDSLADLLEKNLSFNEEETDSSAPTSCATPTTGCTNPIFLAGSKPSKLDLDVMRALDGAQPDPAQFPHLHNWLKNVESFTEQQQKCWRTPTSLKHRPLRSFKAAVEASSQPLSPLVYSSPSTSSSARRREQSVAGMGSSSPPLNHAATTPKQQQTQTPGRYFDFRPSPHQAVTRPLVGYRSTGTTPQRSGLQLSGQNLSGTQFRAPL